MPSLGGGWRNCRRLGSCCSVLILLLIMLPVSAFDDIFTGEFQNVGEPLSSSSIPFCGARVPISATLLASGRRNHLVTILLKNQIRVYLTMVLRSVSVQDRRTFQSQFIPRKPSTTHPAAAPRVCFSIFIKSMAISSRLIAGHGQVISFGGRTFQLYHSSLLRVRYGRLFSTHWNVSCIFVNSFGLMILNGNNGGVPESVPLYAPVPGRRYQRSSLIVNRVSQNFPVLYTGELFQSSLGLVTAEVRFCIPYSTIVVVTPANVCVTACSSSSPLTDGSIFNRGGLGTVKLKNPNGSNGPLGLFVEILFPDSWALKTHSFPKHIIICAGLKIRCFFYGPTSLFIISSLYLAGSFIYVSHPLTKIKVSCSEIVMA